MIRDAIVFFIAPQPSSYLTPLRSPAPITAPQVALGRGHWCCQAASAASHHPLLAGLRPGSYHKA